MNYFNDSIYSNSPSTLQFHKIEHIFLTKLISFVLLQGFSIALPSTWEALPSSINVVDSLTSLQDTLSEAFPGHPIKFHNLTTTSFIFLHNFIIF